jgi:hypothetical protein
MDKFDLDKDYSASYMPLRKGSGYVAKGTVFFQGKPVEIFEARNLSAGAFFYCYTGCFLEASS